MEHNADDKTEFSKLKVPELKKELKSRHLSTAGNKTELMERLLHFVKNKRDNGATVDDFEEDLLNDEDDDHLDNDEHDALLTDLEKTISESETSVTPESKAQKRKATIETDKLAEDTTKPKRVTLTRKSSTNLKEPARVPKVNDPSQADGVVKTSGTPAGASNGTTTKKLIKFSDLSVQERLEMRSKKFGTPLSVDTIKQTRAERFGLNNTINKQAISSEGAASVDVLKQRAKRFGVSVSPSIAKLENLERLEQRKNRFGAGATVTKPATGEKPKVDADTVKAARLDRFK